MTAPSTSVRTLMATLLDRELRARFNLCLSRESCEEIIGAVISGSATIAGSLPFLPPAPPPVRPLDGGCISASVASAVASSSSATPAPRTSDGGRGPSGDAPVVYFSEAAIKRILIQHFWTGEPGEHDAIKAAAQILAALTPATCAGEPE